MQSEHLAIPFNPIQQWDGQQYEPAQALKVGTIFPNLNKPFFAAESLPGESVPNAAGRDTAQKNQEQQERENLMAKIQAVSFVLDDLALYLDTHPNESAPAEMRNNLIQERKKLLQDFSTRFYPLTRDCIGFWTEGPMPWEGACI